MSAIVALITQLLGLVPTIMTAATAVRGAAQQTGEWTPEAEAAYQASLGSGANDPAQKPDPS